MPLSEDQIVTPIPKEIVINFIAKYYPDLKDEAIEYQGGGSFSVYSIGNKLVLRLSKGWIGNREVEKMFEREKTLIELLRNQVVPHKLPEHLKILTDEEIFPGSIWVKKYAQGKTLQSVFNAENQEKLTTLLADFLSKLHNIDYQKLDLSFVKQSQEEITKSWLQNYENNKRDFFSLLSDEERQYMTAVYEEFLSNADNMHSLQCLTHGDFDPVNCLWHPRNNYLNIIDCEDMGFGHAVGDFCSWYGHYGEEFLDKLIEKYTIPTDKYFKERVRFYWLRIPMAYFGYTREYENEKFAEFGRQMLQKNMRRFPIK